MSVISARAGECRFVVAAWLCFIPSLAHAAFINGIETFDGTVKDTVTWEEAHGFTAAGSVTQNEYISTTNADYTTRIQTISVGQSLRLRFGRITTIPPLGGSVTGTASVYLTTNSAGTSDSTIADSRFFGLITRYIVTGTSFDALEGSGGALFGGLTNVALIPGDHSGEWFKLQIDRTLINQARFTVWTDNDVLLGSATRNLPFSTPPTLFISVGGSAGFFDNVAVVVPEPAALAPLVALAAIVSANRRPRAV